MKHERLGLVLVLSGLAIFLGVALLLAGAGNGRSAASIPDVGARASPADLGWAARAAGAQQS